MSKYSILVNGDAVASFSADFAQASSPILLDGESTPFQVADAKHRPGSAPDLLNGWQSSEGGEMYSEGDEVEIEEVESDE